MLVPEASVAFFRVFGRAIPRKAWNGEIALLPSGSYSSEEWKIPTQTCTQANSLWQCTLVLPPPHPPFCLTPRLSFDPEEEEKLPSTLLGSAVGPKNQTDTRQINRRKTCKFYFRFVLVHGYLQRQMKT